MGAFARAVVANHAQALALVQAKRYVLQRPMAAVQVAAGEQRLEPLARRVVQAVFLAQLAPVGSKVALPEGREKGCLTRNKYEIGL